VNNNQNVSEMTDSVLPWIERYRPKTLDDIAGHQDKIATVKRLVDRHELPHLLLYGPPSCSKCLGVGTLVRMADGTLKRVEDIKVGDSVMGENYHGREVTQVVSGFAPLYEIHQEYARNYVVTENHVMSLIKITDIIINKVANLDSNPEYEVIWFLSHQKYTQVFTNFKDANKLVDKLRQHPKLTKLGARLDIPLDLYLQNLDDYQEHYAGYRATPASANVSASSSRISTVTANIAETVIYKKAFALESFDPKTGINIIPSLTMLAGYIDRLGILKQSSDTYDYDYELDLTPNQYPNIMELVETISILAIRLGYRVRTQLMLSDYIHIYLWIEGEDIFMIPCQATQTKKPKDVVVKSAMIERDWRDWTGYITAHPMGYGKYAGFELAPNSHQSLGGARFQLADGTITHNTSFALALARYMYGDNFRQYVLELNASDDRGIDVVRTRIREFVSLASNKSKFVILDEADAMTDVAQNALKRIIEQYTSTSRFCLICNQRNKIIEPLASRCVQFRFTYLSPDDIHQKVSYILQSEQIDVDDQALQHLIYRTRDFRQILNTLQCLNALRLGCQEKEKEKENKKTNPIEIDEIDRYLGIPTSDELKTIKCILFDPQHNHMNFQQACTYLISRFHDNQWNLVDLVQCLARELAFESHLVSYEIYERLSDIEVKLLQSHDSELQIYNLISTGFSLVK
jgi:DNA polymerase III delta prime subunit